MRETGAAHVKRCRHATQGRRARCRMNALNWSFASLTISSSKQLRAGIGVRHGAAGGQGTQNQRAGPKEEQRQEQEERRTWGSRRTTRTQRRQTRAQQDPRDQEGGGRPANIPHTAQSWRPSKSITSHRDRALRGTRVGGRGGGANGPTNTEINHHSAVVGGDRGPNDATASSGGSETATDKNVIEAAGGREATKRRPEPRWSGKARRNGERRSSEKVFKTGPGSKNRSRGTPNKISVEIATNEKGTRRTERSKGTRECEKKFFLISAIPRVSQSVSHCQSLSS